uniref:Uncharacterized protein n=1 Tax=Ditylenchus dipsaci TaxID=166011 RepID=A0A915DRM1_9BILA
MEDITHLTDRLDRAVITTNKRPAYVMYGILACLTRRELIKLSCASNLLLQFIAKHFLSQPFIMLHILDVQLNNNCKSSISYLQKVELWDVFFEPNDIAEFLHTTSSFQDAKNLVICQSEINQQQIHIMLQMITENFKKATSACPYTLWIDSDDEEWKNNISEELENRRTSEYLKIYKGKDEIKLKEKNIAQQHHHRDSQEYVKQRLEAEAIQEDFARGDDLREVQSADPPGGGEDVHEVGGGGSHQDISQFMMKEKSDSVSVLDKQILNFLASNCLPFSIVEEKSFKNLLSINDRTSLQGRRHYSDWVLPRFYKEMKNKSKEKLSKITSLSFTTDIWSGHREFHQNSIMEDTELMELLQKCRSLVAHFRHSNLACERLREGTRARRNSTTPVKQAGINVPTRWNSTYDMCERLIEQKKAIEVYLRVTTPQAGLGETEWDMVGLLVELAGSMSWLRSWPALQGLLFGQYSPVQHRRRRNGYSKKSVNKKGNSMLNKIFRLRPQDDQEGEVVL